MTLYTYAIARADELPADLPAGIAEQPVYRIEAGSLVAFVSDYQGAAIRAERRHIAANQRVLRALQADIDLLPMAFGTLTPDADGVISLLTRRQDKLLSQLERVRGSVEMGIRVNLDVPDPVAYLVEHSAELQQARDRTFGRRKSPSHDERMRLGQLCEAALRRFQETQSAQLVAQLKPSCTEISPLPVHDDKQIANLAVLVPRTGLDAFEAAVNAAAETFNDELAFNLSGPWPPYNFVQLEL